MAILELCAFKVLLWPDLDDGESLWIGRGRRNYGYAVGHGRQRQAALLVVAGSSGKIPNSVSRKAQDD